MINSEAIANGFEQNSVSLSSSGDICSDRSLSDLTVEELTDQLKNVGLHEVSKGHSETKMSVSESNGGLDSNVVDRDGDGGSENESECENRFEKKEIEFPVRPGAEDCSFYMRTGGCKFGSSCKFNHPLPRKVQIARDNKVREQEDGTDKLRLIDCKYYFRTGWCKYGKTCRFNHTNPKSCLLPSLPELNFIGLPIRPGEPECPYYMRNVSCKFGAECKFNHPDPATIGETDSSLIHSNNVESTGTFSPSSMFQANSAPWSSLRQANGTTPFIPAMLSQSHGVPSQTQEWNGYQGCIYSQERSVFSPSSTYLVKNSSTEISQFQHQMPAEEFPERPDQPECSYYMKTGDCRFKFNCKFHHPKNRLPKLPPYALNDKGLPLRPDQNICTHYSRYGICKFGPACRFDHSVQLPCSTGSSHTVVEPTQVGVNESESDGWN